MLEEKILNEEIKLFRVANGTLFMSIEFGFFYYRCKNYCFL